MKAAVAGLTLLVSGCSTKPMFVQVPPSAIESAVSVSMRDSQTAIKQVLVGEGYSALFIGSHETFLQPTSHVALHAYNPNTKEYERSDMAIRQPEQEREQRWQALVTPRFTALSQGYELDARIAQFDWQKPKTLTYIAAQRISESLVHAKNHDQSYDRVVIMQHGLRGSLETIVSSDGRTRLHKITAEQLEAQYPTGSLQHLVKPNGYVLMIVCYGSGGEKSVARVLANAFNRPVIASTTEVLNVGFVLNPYGYVRQKNDRFYVATGIPTYNELRGDFSVVYPNPSRPTQ